MFPPSGLSIGRRIRRMPASLPVGNPMRRTALPAFGWPEATLLLAALIWGSSYGVAKSVLAWMPVAGLLLMRFGLAFVLLAPRLASLWRLRLSAADWRRLLGLGLLLLTTIALETWGIAHTRAANAALLISLCVVFTPLAEWGWLHRRPRRIELVAAAVSLAGAALLCLGDGLRPQPGDALMLLAAISRTALGVLTRAQMLRSPVPAAALTALQSGVVALGSLGLLLALPPHALPALPTAAGFWAALAWLVLGCTLFAFYAQNQGMRHSSATRVALLMGCEPAFGALFAALWLGEKLGWSGWLGGVLIVAAALAATMPPRSAAAAIAPVAQDRLTS